LDWFTVDKEGLYKLLKRKGMEFLVYELVQNAWDTATTKVEVRLEPVDGRPLVQLSVIDDDPDGFQNLAHAYTLFAESQKKGDPEKRGRFNLGEKMILSACIGASITSTTGTVLFNSDGRSSSRKRRDAGTEFRALVRMTRDELASVLVAVRELLPPIPTSINGQQLPTRKPLRTFEATLATEIADEEGFLRRSKRKTQVRVYQSVPGQASHLYEMGIPVVDDDMPWDIEVMQKIPLNAERDNVTPAYLRDVHVAVLNAMHAFLTPEVAALPAVSDALEDDQIEAAAVKAVLTQRYGDKRAVHDPGDAEAGRRLHGQGYQIIQGGSFSKAAWANIKRHDAAQPAGQLSPSPKPYSDDPNAPLRKLIEEFDWTPGMAKMAAYARECARRFVGREIVVRYDVGRVGASWSACYGSGELTFNHARLGQAWFDQGPTAEVNDLLIHELAHEFGDHLSDTFDHALSRMGLAWWRRPSTSPASSLVGIRPSACHSTPDGVTLTDQLLGKADRHVSVAQNVWLRRTCLRGGRQLPRSVGLQHEPVHRWQVGQHGF